MSTDRPVPPRRAGLEIPQVASPRGQASADQAPTRAALDLSGIAPRTKPRPDAGALETLTRAAGFTSRSGPLEAETDELPPPRRRQARARPKVQFNGRVPPDVLGRIVRYCDAHRLSNGEFLEQAIDRLEALSQDR
jgi:hypothetical protein